MSHRTAALLVACSLAAPASAQHAGHTGPSAEGHTAQAANPAQPYASLRHRRVKALSEAQEADLRAGRGMALALAAELNGYPGPMHVLEHAEALRLTPMQRAAAEALRARMADEAQAIGARILVLEEELNGLFVSGDAGTRRLAVLATALGALSGRLRETHLAAHITMRAALDPEQREAYKRLRGYAAAP